MMTNSKDSLSVSRPSIANELYRLRFGTNPNLKMVSESRYIPKFGGKPEGEDAHFICQAKNSIGLADGVGGWAKDGIDSGVYARQLMKNAYEHLYFDPEPFVEPHRLLSAAFSSTKAAGASTACILTVKDNYLHATNIGDSGFLIFRKGDIVYKSPIQEHTFNTPFQLGNDATCTGRPSKASNLKVELEDGDIIIAGTDGLFDNMFASEIQEVIKKGTKNGVDPDALALKIVDQARMNSYDKIKESPFAKNAKEAGKHRVGGKLDDITVIISHIVQV